MRRNAGAIALGKNLLTLLSDEDADMVILDPLRPLTPSQKVIADQLMTGIMAGEVCSLQGEAGMGKTTILKHIHAVLGGVYLPVSCFLDLLRERSPIRLEETFLEVVEQQLRQEEILFIDDLQFLTNAVEGYEFPRKHLFDAVLASILVGAERRGKKLVFASSSEYLPTPIRCRAYSWNLEKFEADDYGALCRAYLPTSAEALDYQRLHRFAPVLNGYQLRNACIWLRQQATPTTDGFIDYLSAQNMTSNVDMDEVAAVDWKNLKGVEDVIEELEAKIALPFENHALANHLSLKPKRGVLLAGPPGTGKTTIGRALAHRLRSKFFLIDGTVVAGSHDFYEKIDHIFESAKKNAPSVIFIDDADVIFEERHHGFHRYLLTMMDGLESASAERVCIMTTAMEVSSLPPAMLRSGRIELWLHTRLPDEEARMHILRQRTAALPAPFDGIDLQRLAKASSGLTGADLKAVVEDAKLLFAHDQMTQKPMADVDEYFLKAMRKIRENRKTYRSKKDTSFGTRIGYSVEQ